MFHTVQCLNLPNFKKCYVYSTERIYGFCFISKINNINQLVFIMETKCVLCEEGPEILSLLKTWTGICTKAFKIEKIFINFYTLWNGFHHCDKDKNPVSVGNRTELFWLVIYTCNKLGYGCLRIDYVLEFSVLLSFRIYQRYVLGLCWQYVWWAGRPG
jgi:hypothetical protein